MQPALGMDEMQEDLAHRPLGRSEPLGEVVVRARVEQGAQLVEVFGQRGLDIYKVSDDVYLKLFPTPTASRTVSNNDGGGTTRPRTLQRR